MSESFDVIVVGLGPVGATVAALLARRGVTVCVIEKDARVYPLPRAAHFDHEIMRLFQTLGIDAEVSKAARPAPAYRFQNAAGQVLMQMDLGGASPSGWSASYMFHQPALELALRALLQASPHVDVRLEWAFEGLAETADGVEVTALAADGSRRTIAAKWLVGCDGAGSPVRKALGVELDDYGFDEPWLVVDAVVKNGSAIPDLNLQICDPARPTTCVLMGPGRHRWEFMLKPDERPEDVMDDALIGRWLTPWGGPAAVQIDRKAVYRFHGLVARQWRRGRVLLAGDAAHQMPPFLGQGMCSGLRDANKLAWKLAAVLKGEGGEALLDTYQSEREPNVRSIVEQAIAMGRIVCTTDRQVAAQRDAGMLAQRAAGGGPRPPGAQPLLSEGCILAGSAAAGSLFPQPWADGAKLDDLLGEAPSLLTRASDLGPLQGAVTAWLDRQGAEAVLVRPDRFVFGTGTETTLRAAWTAALA